VTAVAALMEDSVEAIEVEATASSRLVRSPLSKLGLPKGSLVAAVKRGDRILVPQGSDQVEAGDRVLLITTTDRARQLDPYLEG